MRYEMIGASKIKSSKIIMGTWQADKEMWPGIDYRETMRAIRCAFDLGINTFDTAIVYGDDYSESVVATALKTVAREDYYISSKAFDYKLCPQQTLSRCEESLRNMQTDYIDLYQVYFPSDANSQSRSSIQKVMETLNRLKEAGKILNIGIANCSKEQIAEALKYSEVIGHQPRYLSGRQPYDKSTTDFCRSNHIARLVYSPIIRSLSSSSIEIEPVIKSSAHRSYDTIAQEMASFHIQEVLMGLQKYAEKYNASCSNIVLNWLISRPMSYAIIDAYDLNNVLKKIKCCDFTLSEQEMEEIDELSTQFTNNVWQSETMLGSRYAQHDVAHSYGTSV